MDKSLFLLSGLGILALGLGLGLVLMRLRLSPELNHLRRKVAELTRREEEIAGILERLQAENKNLSSFLVILPDVARRLNSHLDKRNLAPLLGSIIHHIFDPAQILVLIANREERRLVLSYKKGLPDAIPLGYRVGMEGGKIGFVATHLVAMDRDDIQNKIAAVRRLGPGDRALEDSMTGDLIAPMTDENECLGIISIGGISRTPSDRKRMIKMVADLGSLALTNTMMYTRFQAEANSDPLTKMYSKRFLLMNLGDQIHGAETEDAPLSVFIFDIDHFKNYNDAHGHVQGDELLRILGRLVRQEIRETDVAARYGGEEFVVILPNTRKEQALASAEKIRRVIEAYPFPDRESQPLGRVTVSGGVATYGIDGRTTNELLRAADQALYLAKQQGRNRVLAYKIRFLSDEEEVLA